MFHTNQSMIINNSLLKTLWLLQFLIFSNAFCYDKSYVHSKLQFFLSQQIKILTMILIHLNQTKKITVTSMFVTDVGDQMCWWQVWDVSDRFRIMVTDLIHWENHQDSITRMTKMKISISSFWETKEQVYCWYLTKSNTFIAKNFSNFSTWSEKTKNDEHLSKMKMYDLEK